MAIRGTLDPNDPGHKDRLTGVILSLDEYYDPHAKLIKSPEDFLSLLQTADEHGKPLYIMVPHPWAAAFKVPTLWRLFNESGLFTDYVYFRGLDQTNDRVIARYQPGSARHFKLEAFLRGREGVPNPNLPPLEFPNKPIIDPTMPQTRANLGTYSTASIITIEANPTELTWIDVSRSCRLRAESNNYQSDFKRQVANYWAIEARNGV